MTRPIFFSIVSFLLGAVWVVHRVSPESAPVARGAAFAQTNGCIECHGKPENQLVDATDQDCSSGKRMVWHSDIKVGCKDIMAYFEAVRLRRSFNDRIRMGENNRLVTGEKLARKYHCFQCHGQLGQGGFKNDKSLKGYIPGFFGGDFRALTRNANRNSVREWISYGLDSKISEQPVTGRIAQFFFERQTVSMPSFKSLESDEIELLVDYVIEINNIGPMTADLVRSYGNRSISFERPNRPDWGTKNTSGDGDQ